MSGPARDQAGLGPSGLERRAFEFEGKTEAAGAVVPKP